MFQYLFTELTEFERSEFVTMFLSDTSGFSSRLNRFVLLLKAGIAFDLSNESFELL